MSAPEAPSGHPAPPPETWLAAQRLRVSLMAPIERFLHIETASGILLLGAAVIALAWANAAPESYEHLWHTKLAVSLGSFSFDKSLHFWVNDVLMAIFFFVVGLEIKREITFGELSEWKRASLPVAAAIGGMVVPAGIYTALNHGTPHQSGWGVPMATDIAFAVGVLTLLGSRVPAALRVLLLALAIIDDIGAIIVIAAFYSGELDPGGLVWIGAGLGITWFAKRSGVRPPVFYLPPGALVWWGTYQLGVHPTVAGVALGLLTPSRPWFGREGFLAEAHKALDEFHRNVDAEDDHRIMAPLERIAVAQREALSPVVRLQAMLHPWVAWVIMPVFALANAGVHLGGVDVGAGGALSVAWGVALGLVVGKPLGVVVASWLAVRSGLSALPRGVGYVGLVVVGATAGIGFTMAIFIAELAFTDAAMLGVAKLFVLVASTVSAVLGLVVGRVFLEALPDDVSVHEAEQRTDL